MKRKMLLMLMVLFSVFLSSCRGKTADPEKNFEHIVDELVKSSENRDSLRITRAVYEQPSNTEIVFYIEFSVKDYYDVIHFHSLIGKYKSNKKQEINHTGLEDQTTKIKDEVDRVFGLFSNTEKGSYLGYKNLDINFIESVVNQRIKEYYES